MRKMEKMEELKKLIQSIKNLQCELFNHYKEKEKIKKELEIVELDILNSIRSELDENLKPRFSNDDKRKLELYHREVNDSLYLSKLTSLNDILKTINNMEISLEENRLTFRMHEILSRIS